MNSSAPVRPKPFHEISINDFMRVVTSQSVSARSRRWELSAPYYWWEWVAFKLQQVMTLIWCTRHRYVLCLWDLGKKLEEDWFGAAFPHFPAPGWSFAACTLCTQVLGLCSFYRVLISFSRSLFQCQWSAKMTAVRSQAVAILGVTKYNVHSGLLGRDFLGYSRLGSDTERERLLDLSFMGPIPLALLWFLPLARREWWLCKVLDISHVSGDFGFFGELTSQGGYPFHLQKGRVQVPSESCCLGTVLSHVSHSRGNTRAS